MILDPIQACRFWLHDTAAPYTFSDPQIQEFLGLERVVDADGYEPDDDDYTPTYDVLRAAGRGWLWLAAVADNKMQSYRVGDVSVTYDKDYCLRRARELMGSAVGLATRADEQTSPDASFRYRTS